jgi:hypothetical protein
VNIFSTLAQGDGSYWLDDPYTDANGVTYDSAGYQLAYTIAGPIDSPVSLAASANGPGWRTELTATVSAGLAAGLYWWQAVLTAPNVRLTIGSGELEIARSLASVTGRYDGRSLAERALADAEEALAKFQASGGRLKQYKIGGREMVFQDDSQILKVLSYWRMRVMRERNAAKIAQGLGDPRANYVRFRRF